MVKNEKFLKLEREVYTIALISTALPDRSVCSYQGSRPIFPIKTLTSKLYLSCVAKPDINSTAFWPMSLQRTSI